MKINVYKTKPNIMDHHYNPFTIFNNSFNNIFISDSNILKKKSFTIPIPFTKKSYINFYDNNSKRLIEIKEKYEIYSNLMVECNSCEKYKNYNIYYFNYAGGKSTSIFANKPFVRLSDTEGIVINYIIKNTINGIYPCTIEELEQINLSAKDVLLFNMGNDNLLNIFYNFSIIYNQITIDIIQLLSDISVLRLLNQYKKESLTNKYLDYLVKNRYKSSIKEYDSTVLKDMMILLSNITPIYDIYIQYEDFINKLKSILGFFNYFNSNHPSLVEQERIKNNLGYESMYFTSESTTTYFDPRKGDN